MARAAANKSVAINAGTIAALVSPEDQLSRVIALRLIDDSERRARLARRHALAPLHRVRDAQAAVNAMMVLHATEPATPYLSVLARVESFMPKDLEDALFESRTLVKQLAMVGREGRPRIHPGRSRPYRAHVGSGCRTQWRRSTPGRSPTARGMARRRDGTCAIQVTNDAKRMILPSASSTG